MLADQVEKLRLVLDGDLIETHISWVILTDSKAYKIKKPLSFSFLDFSTLERRKYFCEREFELNSRLTDIYLQVTPIFQIDQDIFIDSKEGKIIDYAVSMKRVPDEKRMDLLLAKNLVEVSHIDRLAEVIVDFHKSAQIVYDLDDMAFVEKRFKDVLVVSDWIESNLAKDLHSILQKAMVFHFSFIKSKKNLLIERVQSGFKRDLHGDLHTQNIFLDNEPIVFDCIEFDDRYRQIDMLSEMAFLCMDLEAKGRKDLSNQLMSTYLDLFPMINSEKDKELFRYYKCYRAGVRIKVNGLRAMQEENPVLLNYLKGEATSYLRILKKYLSE